MNLKQIKYFLNPQISDELAPGFEQEIFKTTLPSGRIMVIVILLFELFNMGYVIRYNRVSTFASKVYFFSYIALTLVTIGMVLVAYKWRNTNVKRVNRYIGVFGAFIAIWAAFISAYDQRESSNISVYVNMILALSLFIYLKPWQSIAAFTSGQILFYVLAGLFMPDAGQAFSVYVNTSIVSVVAIVISSTRYHSTLAGYRKNCLIERQNQKIRSMNEQLNLQVITDQMTCMYNRRFLDEELPGKWKAYQQSGKPMAMIMIDIDFFKAYNDHYGHQEGDRCIREVAAVICGRASRDTDYAIRFGGEEFLLVLADTDWERVSDISESICHRVERLDIRHIKSPNSRITVSIGFVVSDTAIDIDQLIRLADKAMYNSKESGKNRITGWRKEK